MKEAGMGASLFRLLFCMIKYQYFYYIKKSTRFLIFLYSENDLFDLQ